MHWVRSSKVFVFLLLTACAVPDMAAPSAAASMAELRGRITSPEALESALALLPASSLSVAVAALPEARDPATLDADAPDWWLAMACAFNPQVRAARLALQATLARAGGMGAPMALGTESDYMNSAGSGAELELKVMVDLLGILGIGRSAAEKELGRSEVRAARGMLALALWQAQFEAQRARVTLAARRALKTDLDLLVKEAEADQARILQLQIHGRLAEKDVAAARTQWHRLLEMRSETVGEVANSEAALAVACGLPPDAAPLTRISLATIEDFDVPGGVPKMPEPEVALSARPDMQQLSLEFAVREAELRLAARQAIPLLAPAYAPLFAQGMKPQAGAMLRMDINWPTAVQAGIDEALARREAASIAWTDAALAAWAQLRATRAEMMAAYENMSVHVPIVDQATTTSWNAARRSFALDRVMLPDWTMELERRMDGLAMMARHREHGLTKILDYLEALGPRSEGVAP